MRSGSRFKISLMAPVIAAPLAAVIFAPVAARAGDCHFSGRIQTGGKLFNIGGVRVASSGLRLAELVEFARVYSDQLREVVEHMGPPLVLRCAWRG